jgi:ATPase subunit of ABC transporter with duplicated ATPase domains
MLKLKNITKYFGPLTVLNKISFSLEKGNRIALTGYNGSGKTTLLNIITGQETYSNGSIEIHKDAKIGFLPQDPKSFNDRNVLEFLKETTGQSDDKFLRQVEIMFAGFWLPSNIKEKNIGDLSSGQKTKVFLTGLLLQDIDILLLDEPTNNLDLPALIWLEDYLKNTKSGCLIVSHDRAFLDAVANKVFEIDWYDHTLKISHAKKYSNYLIEKQKETQRISQEHDMQIEEILRLRDLKESKEEKAAKGAKWRGNDNDRLLIGYRRNKAGKSYKEAKVVGNRIRRIEVVRKPSERKGLSIDIIPGNKEASQNISLKKAVCGYDDGFSIGPLDMDIVFGKRICFMGPNGIGKSTILKSITGKIPLISGSISVDSGVRFGNFMQEHESLPQERTPLEFFSGFDNTGKELIFNHLVSFGFSELSINSEIGKLSSGGRARLLFAYFAAMNVNVLILDEPTNHLDMEAEDALEKALKEFNGTVITVSHDRYFVEKMNFDEYYVVSEDGIKSVDDMTEYVENMEKRAKKLLRMLGR